MENKSIALDGPAGAGKSTLSKMASKRFGLIYVDTGALYRCVGLYVLRKGVEPRDEASVKALLPEISPVMKYDDDGVQRMYLGGEDVTEEIRMPEVSSYASDVSALPPVREYLLSQQRRMAEEYDVIMDGRDIGTVIMPKAGLKVFLTAEPEVRARRRYLELREKGIGTTPEKVLEEMAQRDKNDSERDVAPLRAADDAVILDTTNMDLGESFEALCALISGRLGA
ncbi:MAG: (d)CMP kinase [Oscillospiraceae bacterium]|nr:(d)CMP kinase [Oscillospiraceae bacterium]